MGRPFKCPCGASNSVAKGFRKTKTMGVRQIRRCRKCRRKFTPKHQKARANQEVRRKPDRPRRPVQTEPSAGNEHFDDGEWSKLADDSQPSNPADESNQTATR
jgi:hypothetical protein